MIIPIGTDRPLRRPTLVTYALIALNVLVALVLLVLERSAPGQAARAFDVAMLHPTELRWWALVSYAFLHGGLLHLLGNMVALWVFGPNVEDRLGRVWFVVFYLAGGVVAGLAHCALERAPVVGASGAIAAVTGAYLVLFPRTLIKVFVFFVLIGVYSIPAVYFIAFSIAKDLFWFAATTSVVGAVRFEDSVARAAHLAGYGMGAVVSLMLLWTRVVPREAYDLFSIGRQALRRRQFRELSARGAGGVPTQVSAEQGRRRNGSEDPRLAALAAARVEVSEFMSKGDTRAAAERYRSLLGTFGDLPGAGTLSRRALSELGNACFAAGDYVTALAAYESFVQAYGSDRDAPRVSLMIGLINARYLNDPVKAKRVLTEVEGRLRDDDERRQARQLLAELG